MDIEFNSNFPHQLENLLAKRKVPGCAIGIVDSSNTHFIVSGKRRDDLEVGVNEQTSFAIASLTKPMFAFLVHKILQEGKLSIDEPLNNYLDESYTNTKFIDKITTRHVLSHTSGFPNWCYNTPLIQEFKPGTRFQYSGEGFVFLQIVIESLFGRKIEDLLDEMVFKPLSLKNTAANSAILLNQNRAEGHDENGAKIRNPKFKLDEETERRLGNPSNMAGTIWASVEDYNKFLSHLMIEERGILDMMTAEQIKYPKWQISWGLGIGLEFSKSQSYMWQWGSERTWKNFLYADFNNNQAITIFSNGANGKGLCAEILMSFYSLSPNYYKYD